MYGKDHVFLKKVFKKLVHIIFVLSLFVLPCGAEGEFLVLCYHDIPRIASLPEDVPQHIFVKQLEYLKIHGYTIISPHDIQNAQKGEKLLSEKSVLLTFDDGYRSFYEFVYPILKFYGYPAVLSIVTSWINRKPDYVGAKELMTWKQIQDVAHSELISIASHTHDFHRGVLSNPSGNKEPAPFTFAYLPEEKRYEKEDDLRSRIHDDLQKSVEILKTKTGIAPCIVTWPYGKFNHLCIEEAKKHGFELMFTLIPGCSDINKPNSINRNIITEDMKLDGFISRMKDNFRYFERHRVRAVQVDLDMIVNPQSYEESDYNLGLLIERLIALGVNTVFLQGFSDTDGSGNIRSLYFANETLPVELDFLSHAANRIRIRGMQVFIWMPVLSFELVDEILNEELKVKEFTNSSVCTTTSWYRRLTPFDERSLDVVLSIYKDLASRVRFNGILFQDDAYLTDNEDYHPAARKAFKRAFHEDLNPQILENDHIRHQWVHMKTEKVDNFIEALKRVVRRYRPTAQFARNIYSEVVLNPSAQEWFCQDLEAFLERYEYTVIMAYPQMEGVYGLGNIKKWFTRLINRVEEYPSSGKIIFKTQACDWSKHSWLSGNTIREELQFLLASGIKHIGYYPDNVFEDKPELKEITSIISAREFPRAW
ncbi:MAG: poly-beta-1,6-N-acetyl-D-glucosamine N-deacetylase PgaB [Thermodesulfobacteriota bacterium]|nr:poly-beta-1,6-N-acetyl-D-glucosamine N-deacetylase PgaB [Thermodesulfobacteriota bacterium]